MHSYYTLVKGIDKGIVITQVHLFIIVYDQEKAVLVIRRFINFVVHPLLRHISIEGIILWTSSAWSHVEDLK